MNDDATFIKLVQLNAPYRLYFISYLITETGSWFTYVASIELIEKLLENDGSSSSRTAISILVVLRLIPNTMLSFLGGVLADSRDRRKSMILLDILGATIVLLYILAYHCKSIFMVYLTAFLQECISALYEPCRSSIIPLLVTNDEYLKKATTLSGLSWSSMQAFGSFLGGIAVGKLGFQNCFVIDCATYLIAASLMSLVRGHYNVADPANDTNIYPLQNLKGMTVDATRYLSSSFFGPLVLIKSSGGLVFGIYDVLNVSFSEMFNGESKIGSEERLGYLFGVVGLGCLIGPLVSDRLTDIKHPETLQLACVWSFGLMAFGCIGMGLVFPFAFICLFTGIRAAGSSILWIDSDILLQKFSEPIMLGRVLAIDYALATAAEAGAAMLCGILQDNTKLSPEAVSLIFGALSTVFFFVWSVFHMNGGGVNSMRGNKEENERLLGL